jgi:hypothetical protein
VKDFKSSTFAIDLFGVTIPCYAAVSTLVVNIVIAVVLSALFNALSKAPRADATVAADYH